MYVHIMLYVPSVKTLSFSITLLDTWHECPTIRGHHSTVLFNLLQSVISTWWTREPVNAALVSLTLRYLKC